MTQRRFFVLLAAVLALTIGLFTGVSADPGVQNAVSGRVKQRDATLLHSDRLVFALTGVQAPEFGSLRGYLIKDDGETVMPVGELTVTDGAITGEWDSPTQENLIGNYNTFRITHEEVYTSAQLPVQALAHIRHVVYMRSDTPGNIGYGVGLVQQADVLLTHATNAKTWADQGDLAEAKRHTEHAINILVGEDSPLFKDWNGDGNLQNPGDGFGILPGTEDLNGDGKVNVGYVKGTHDHIKNAANSPDATDNIKARAAQVKSATYNIMGRGNRAYPSWGSEFLYQAMIVLHTEDVNTAKAAAEKMVAFANLILNGQDLDGNGKVDPVIGEGGAKTAYLYAQHAADYYPQEVMVPAMLSLYLPFITRPAIASGGVSFQNEVQPIFNARCITCHGDAGPEDGLSLTSYENVMAGSNAGPVVLPGDPANSELVKRIKGISQPRMPFGQMPLTPQQIQLIETWIAQGAQNN